MLYDIGSSNPLLSDNLKGQDRVRGRFKSEGTYVYLWLIHADVWQKPTQHCKTLIFHLKINTLKKLKKNGNLKENRP